MLTKSLWATAGKFVQHAEELALADDQRLELGFGDHAGRPGSLVEQGQLPEVATWAERGDLALPLTDCGLTVEDQIELVPDRALGHDLGPRTHSHHVRDPRNEPQLLLI